MFATLNNTTVPDGNYVSENLRIVTNHTNTHFHEKF